MKSTDSLGNQKEKRLANGGREKKDKDAPRGQRGQVISGSARDQLDL